MNNEYKTAKHSKDISVLYFSVVKLPGKTAQFN